MKTKMLLLVCLVFLIGGIFLLLNATGLGMDAAQRAIVQNGGSMDTEKYYLIMQSNALSWQLTGAICALVGGLGALLFGYKISR